MTASVETLNQWSESWVELAWAVTWQSALIVVGVFAVLALIRRWSSPTLRYWVWQIVVIKVLLMPFWTVGVSIPYFSLDGNRPEVISDSQTACAASMPMTGGSEELHQIGTTDLSKPTTALVSSESLTAIAQLSWQSWLLLVWLLVVVVQFTNLLCQSRQLRRLLRRATLAPEPLRDRISLLSEMLGLRHEPKAVVTNADCSFFATGIWRPVIVLPNHLLAGLDEPRLQQVLLHELAHVKRRDLLFGWLAEIARRLFFFNPFMYWLAYSVRLERELACDQLAMIHSGRRPIEYMRTLVDIVAHSSQPLCLKAAAMHGNKP